MPQHTLPFQDNQLHKWAEQNPTPFYIYDECAIRTTSRLLNDTFSFNPCYRNFFAVKANPNLHILQVLAEEGMGADCSSLAELQLARSIGLDGDMVMFTSNNTTLAEYQLATEMGAIVNFDDLTQVDFALENGITPGMCAMRLNPGPTRAGNSIIGEPCEAKFGASEAQVIEGFRRLRDGGVKRFAIHTMIVSNCLDVAELGDTARLLADLVVKLETELGVTIALIDLGGGIGVNYRPEQPSIDLPMLGSAVRATLTATLGDRVTRDADSPGAIAVTTECGRFVLGPAGTLVTRALHRKRTFKNYLGLDANMANLMRPGLYGSYHHITVHAVDDAKADALRSLWRATAPGRVFASRGPGAVPDNTAELAGHPLVASGDKTVAEVAGLVDVVGSLCENFDKFAVDRSLVDASGAPVEAQPGDVLVIHDAGAHGHSMGFQYNGSLRCAEYLLEEGSGRLRLIRRAETVDDFFGTVVGEKNAEKC